MLKIILRFFGKTKEEEDIAAEVRYYQSLAAYHV